MQMREDVGARFHGHFVKYSTAFFSCNGAIFLFDLSTFTDNISRQRCLCPNNFPFFSLLDIESLCFHYPFLCRYTLGVFWLQFYCCLLFVCVCVCVCVFGGADLIQRTLFIHSIIPMIQWLLRSGLTATMAN